MAPPPVSPAVKDPKVGLSMAMHYLKTAAPNEFTALLNVLGEWESREILASVHAAPDKIFNQQGRAQVMHEMMVLLVECSTKTRQYEEKMNGHRPDARPGA